MWFCELFGHVPVFCILGYGILWCMFFFLDFWVVISFSNCIWFALKEKRNERIKRSKKG